jgi:hypothetical protein
MTQIEWGSIEVIDGDQSIGFPLNPLYPLNMDSALSSQVKGRTGVQLGSKRTPDQNELDRLGPRHRGSWNGSISGRSVIVHIYETEAG